MAFIGNTNITQAFTPAVDFFSGNGSTTAFTLSRPVASVAQVEVYVSNVPQTPSTAYTVSSNTITFTSAPLSGTNNIYVYYTSPITQVIAPGQNTVYPSSLSTTNALYWDTSGNVGIGYTSMSQKLQVNGNIALAASTGLLWDTNGSWQISSDDSTYIRFVTSGSEKMRIDSSGNVGIGTSSPSYALDIRSGSLSGALGVNLTSGTTLTTAQGSTTNVDMAFVTKGAGLYTWTQGSTERMRIDSSGNLLIGTTSLLSTTERLSIVNSNNAMINVRNSGATAGRYWNIQADASNTFYIYNASNAGVYITNGGTSWSSSSDENLKNITGEIQNGLSKVCSLRAAEFTWKTDEENKPQVGLIAQDVEKVLPQVVDTSPEGYLGVRYSETVPLLVAAIKEQQALITALTARIEALENK